MSSLKYKTMSRLIYGITVIKPEMYFFQVLIRDKR